MGGYIGAKVGTVTANAADIKGDISSTDTSPDFTLKNTTQEDTDGGRESTITFKGEQSGGEESTLAEIRASHDGTSDDEKGDLIFKTNDGSDGASPTERVRIDSNGDAIFATGSDIRTDTAGTDNVRIGSGALGAIQSGGNENVAVGKDALAAQTTADNNTAVGTEALAANTTASSNTAFGWNALKSNTTGNNNVAIGAAALDAITAGDKNVAIGVSALGQQNTSNGGDTHNVAVGHASGSSITSGTVNTLLGSLSGTDLVDGSNNVALGYNAGASITSGDQNTVVGSLSGDAITSGEYNTALGYKALSLDTQGNRAVAVGYEALANQNFTSSNDNQNTAVGFHAGKEITTGTENVAIGGEALDALTVGNGNVAVGVQALSADINGSRSVAVGATALKVQEASGSTSNNYYNVGVGYGAGDDISTGYYNTCIGASAGNGLTTGNQNIFIGYDCVTNTSSDTKQIAIGTVMNSVGGGYITMGHTVDGRIYNQYTSNASWTRTSDERIKKDIETNTDCGLDFINDLRTVTYKWKPPSEHPEEFASYKADVTEASYSEKMYGFIAQEVKAAMDTHNITGFNGWHVTPENQGSQQGVSYEMFVMPLVKAVQELSAKVDALETENTAIKARLDALEAE